MANKFLDLTGLEYFYGKLKEAFSTKEEVSQSISTSLENYVTNENLNEKGYITTINADLKYLEKSGKAASAVVSDKVANNLTINGQSYNGSSAVEISVGGDVTSISTSEIDDILRG